MVHSHLQRLVPQLLFSSRYFVYRPAASSQEPKEDSDGEEEAPPQVRQPDSKNPQIEEVIRMVPLSLRTTFYPHSRFGVGGKGGKRSPCFWFQRPPGACLSPLNLWLELNVKRKHCMGHKEPAEGCILQRYKLNHDKPPNLIINQSLV